LKTAQEDDIKQHISDYIKNFEKEHGQKPQESTINTKYAVIKKYYNWSKRPEIVKWIKIKKFNKKN